MAEPLIHASTETLIAEFARSGVRELHIRSGDFELYLSNDETASGPIARGAPRQLVSAPALAATPSTSRAAAPVAPALAELPDTAVIVRAPNLGTFYRAPKPGAAAYVEVGSQITEGSELCLIEVMKLFTTVRAEFSGRIHAVLAADGSMVEADQPLFAILRD